MLNSKYRFHSRGGVKYTYKHGKTIRRPQISLVHTENKKGQQRFSVVVSKKIFKSAVKRNLIRRRIYEAIRLELPEYKIKKDHIFIIYSRDLATLPFSDLRTLIHGLLKESLI